MSAPRPAAFGAGSQSESDGHRLHTQMERVRDHMLQAAARGRWLTLSEIRASLEASWRCRFPEASVSAQLRHLKKRAFGTYRLEKRRRHGPLSGLFEYRLLPPDPPKLVQADLFAAAAVR